MNAFYSTGQVARELGCTQARIRSLCQAEAISAELSEGGQFRISRPELDRLKRDGFGTREK